MLKVRPVFLLYRLASFAERHRTWAAFLIVLSVVVSLDVLFRGLLYERYALLLEYLGLGLPNPAHLDMSYDQTWISLLSMVLGTLIIVISIASQSIPKLIDLYMQDWPSLLYVWFLIVGTGHMLMIKVFGEYGHPSEASQMFSVHFLLPAGIIISFPYIFYILKYTKPSNVINRIIQSNLELIQSLTFKRTHRLFEDEVLVEGYQFMLFESLNQLDDLLEYVSFKEPKADIIHNMSVSIQKYVELKAAIHRGFFKVSPKVRSDISFKTMIGQFGEMERTATFYEQKCLRLLGNVYIKLLDQGQFDLSSLCVAEMTQIGLAAVQTSDDHLLDVLIIRFNTILRFAIKHGVKNNEARNLYNAAFHYGNFVEHLVRYKKIEHVKRCFFYFRIYGTEVFRHGRNSQPMYFIVDVIAAEMKKILIQAYEQQWEVPVQNGLLGEFLQVDNPPDYNKQDLDVGQLINNGVRVLQTGLALFYLRENMQEFAKRIITDILDDHKQLGETVFRRVVDMTCNRLKFSGPTFWEDTDRGNLNIYYTSDQAQIESFKTHLLMRMEEIVLANAVERYQFTSEEVQVANKLLELAEKRNLTELLTDVSIFEQTIGKLNEVDQTTLTSLVTLRRKLHFTSDNPELRIKTTRQIALNTEVEVWASHAKKPIPRKAKVVSNYLNYFYLKFLKSEEAPESLPTGIVTFRFKPPHQSRTYQFDARLEMVPSEGPMVRVAHVDTLQIVAHH